MKFFIPILSVLLLAGCSSEEEPAPAYDLERDELIIDFLTHLNQRQPADLLDTMTQLESRIQAREFFNLIREKLEYRRLVLNYQKQLEDQKLISAVQTAELLSDLALTGKTNEMIALTTYLETRPFKSSASGELQMELLKDQLTFYLEKPEVQKLLDQDRADIETLKAAEFRILCTNFLKDYQRLILFDPIYSGLAMKYPEIGPFEAEFKQATELLDSKRSAYQKIPYQQKKHLATKSSLKLVEQWQNITAALKEPEKTREAIQALEQFIIDTPISKSLISYTYKRSPLLRDFILRGGDHHNSPTTMYLNALQDQRKREALKKQQEEEKQKRLEKERRQQEEARKASEAAAAKPVKKTTVEKVETIEVSPELNEKSDVEEKEPPRKRTLLDLFTNGK